MSTTTATPSSSAPTKIKAGVFTKYAPIKEGLKVDASFPKPVAKEGEALIRVRASSVNPVDWKILEGHARSLMEFQFPCVGGRDLCGTIESFGDDRTKERARAEFGLKVGDDVFGMVREGGFAEYCAVDIAALVHKPKNLSYAQAAAVPVVCLTSWQALFEKGRLTKGERVLILGGTAATGLAGIQLAKRAGAHVAATCSSHNAALVKSFGADVVIDYRITDWADALKGQDYDLVYDAVGDRDAYIRSAQVLKQGGRFVTIIGSKGDNTSAPEAKGIEFKRWMVQVNRAHLEEIKKAVEEGALKPRVHGTYSLDELARAMEENKAGHVVGKIAISID